MPAKKHDTPTQKMKAVGAVSIEDLAHAIRQHNANVEATATAIAEMLLPKFDAIGDRLDAMSNAIVDRMNGLERRIEQVDRDCKERVDRLTNKVISIDARLADIEGCVQELQTKKGNST